MSADAGQEQAAKQVEQEHRAVTAMYARLDQMRESARGQRQRVLAAPVEMETDLFARDVEVIRLARLIGDLDAAEASLCFGRIDPAAGPALHIGRRGLHDELGRTLLTDWRAEAAHPFYAATPAAPLELRRRRHLRTADRAVVAVTDEILDGSPPGPDDVVGDGPLVEVLDRARTGRMREAVSTLQAEQDKIVRSAHRGITVVQGGPGTGKTVVALHRAAYVLYAFSNLARRGVLVHGPNRRFLDYISEVLPSLGENDVRLSTVEDLVGLTAGHDDEPAVARRKGRAELAAALEDWVAGHRPRGIALTVRVGQDVLTLDAATIDRTTRRSLADRPGHNPARRVFVEQVVEDLVELIESRAAATLEAFDAEATAMGIDLDRGVASDLASLGFDTEPTGSGQPEFDAERLRTALLADDDLDAAVERVWPRLDPTATLREFLTGRTDLGGSQDTFSRADLALLDEVRDLVEGPPETGYGHIVVDEAQELTEMEWRMLMRRCPARSFTVVGDFAQAGSASTVRGWHEALGPFAGDRFEQYTLSVNYRTTQQILQAAAPLLARIAPEQRSSTSIREGAPPVHLHAADDELLGTVTEQVRRQHHEHPGELVGVIAADEQFARLSALSRALGAARLVPAAQSRGLEFDAVLVVDPAQIETARPAGVRDLYVATTRATKRLIVIEVIPPAR